jgi:multiple sugar transport system permease protein
MSGRRCYLRERRPGSIMVTLVHNCRQGAGTMLVKTMPEARRRRQGLSLHARDTLAAYLFISPWIVGFIVFSFGPMIASLFLSLTSYNMVEAPNWVGFANYVQAFTKDEQFWPSLRKTVYFVALDVPIGITLSLLVAVMLNQKLRATSIFRTLFFLPSITPTVAAILFWIWLLNPEFGLVNYMLGLVGIWGPAWLGSPDWAIPSLVLIDLWATIGGTRMIIFLAGLQGIPQELYEAAEVDGASNWRRLIHVTLPLLTPSIFFVTVLTVIYALRVFTSAYIATSGGPAYATWFYTYHLFKQAFQFFMMGYASALGWLFFVVVLAFTYIQFRWQSSWVHYEGGR